MSQQARSPRPFSSVESMLQFHGLHHYSELLKANGYDDPQFLVEVSDGELREIGIEPSTDRDKVGKG